MIQLKSAREIETMAEGGKILGDTVKMLRGVVRPGMSTLELDAIQIQNLWHYLGLPTV